MRIAGAPKGASGNPCDPLDELVECRSVGAKHRRQRHLVVDLDPVGGLLQRPELIRQRDLLASPDNGEAGSFEQLEQQSREAAPPLLTTAMPYGLPRRLAITGERSDELDPRLGRSIRQADRRLSPRLPAEIAPLGMLRPSPLDMTPHECARHRHQNRRVIDVAQAVAREPSSDRLMRADDRRGAGPGGDTAEPPEGSA